MDAILLLAHGTPDGPEDVPCFLHAVTGGRPIPPEVIKEVQHRYSLIGRSPLRDLTNAQAALVEEQTGTRVYVAMRNWTPYIPEVVERMMVDGVKRAVAVCLAPQNSRTSTGLYRKALFGESGQTPFACEFVASWHDQPELIAAFADKLRSGLKDKPANTPVIFTAHSVPTRTIADGDPYEQQARETAALVAQQAGVANWRFAFQSQGMSGGPWLGPTVEETIATLKDEGHCAVFLQPVGFVCDHIEVLYDIDIAFKRFASKRGVELWRAESLNASPLLAQAIARVAQKAVNGQ